MAHSTPQTAAEEVAAPIAGGDDSSTYARNLLKVRVPVTVALASQRISIQEIIELGPGSIVKFTKTCDEPLTLTVGDRAIATGEIVKVGDKFGLRIGQLVAADATR